MQDDYLILKSLNESIDFIVLSLVNKLETNKEELRIECL